jgi:hypothetical protein
MLTEILLYLVVYIAKMSEVDYLQFLFPRTCFGYGQAAMPSKVV